MKPLRPALLLYLLTFGLCIGLVTLPAACAGNQRQKTLRTTVVSVNAARDGFLAYDKSHQLSIVEKAASREDGERDLAAYRLRRTPVVEGFEVAYRSIAVAATATDDPSLQAALEASRRMIDAITSLTKGP